MSAPIRFEEKNRITDPSLHMAYHFEDVRLNSTAVATSTAAGGLVGNIPSLQLVLEGRTALPALSISLKQVTSLFALYGLHLTAWFPSKVDTNEKALVLEGYHTSNENTERILLFIPLSRGSGANPFTPLEQEIENKTKTPLDLNGLIPKSSFSYYKYTENNVLYHMVFFDGSDLKYLTLKDIPETTYKTDKKVDNLYQSTDFPVHRTKISGSFEDNIYIDCVPVEALEKPKDFLKVNTSFSGNNPKKLVDLIVALATFVLLILVIGGIFKLGIYLSTKKAIKPAQIVSTPLRSLQLSSANPIGPVSGQS
jgi:hypothetical protein